MLNKKEKTIAIQIRLPESTKKKLDIILSKTGVTQSNLLRLYVDKYISTHQDLLDE
jgi:predicted DNA-binding protein